MKKIISSIVMLVSLSAFANPNVLLGKYTSKVGKGEATIKKSNGEYLLNLTNEKDQVYLEDEVLTVNKEGALVLNIDQECDDPGCRYFNNISVLVKKVGSARPTFELSYEGFDYHEDGTDVVREFSETIKYSKK